MSVYSFSSFFSLFCVYMARFWLKHGYRAAPCGQSKGGAPCQDESLLKPTSKETHCLPELSHWVTVVGLRKGINCWAAAAGRRKWENMREMSLQPPRSVQEVKRYSKCGTEVPWSPEETYGGAGCPPADHRHHKEQISMYSPGEAQVVLRGQGLRWKLNDFITDNATF